MLAEYFYNPEKLLRARLSKNPVYPFTEVEKNVYVVSNTPKRYIIACIICAVVLVVTIVICVTTGHVTEYIVIPILLCLYFTPQMFAIRGPRTLVVDFNQYSYEVCGVPIRDGSRLSLSLSCCGVECNSANQLVIRR